MYAHAIQPQWQVVKILRIIHVLMILNTVKSNGALFMFIDKYIYDS